jgi:hypothetical protein
MQSLKERESDAASEDRRYREIPQDKGERPSGEPTNAI